jgi:hypothetical protein
MNTQTVPTTALEVIEALDFQPDVACESTLVICECRGDHSADWYITSHCRGAIPVCSAAVAWCREVLARPGFVYCASCGDETIDGSYWRVLGPVKPNP